MQKQNERVLVFGIQGIAVASMLGLLANSFSTGIIIFVIFDAYCFLMAKLDDMHNDMAKPEAKS